MPRPPIDSTSDARSFEHGKVEVLPLDFDSATAIYSAAARVLWVQVWVGDK